MSFNNPKISAMQGLKPFFTNSLLLLMVFRKCILAGADLSNGRNAPGTKVLMVICIYSCVSHSCLFLSGMMPTLLKPQSSTVITVNLLAAPRST
jgi:hypothetical protein